MSWTRIPVSRKRNRVGPRLGQQSFGVILERMEVLLQKGVLQQMNRETGVRECKKYFILKKKKRDKRLVFYQTSTKKAYGILRKLKRQNGLIFEVLNLWTLVELWINVKE